MKIRNRRTAFVLLKGGLGNQLFQLAAALNVSKDSTIRLNWSLARPKLEEFGLPALSKFLLPVNVVFDAPRSLLRRITRPTFLIRKHIESEFVQSNNIKTRTVINSLASSVHSFLCLLYFKRNLSIVNQDNWNIVRREEHSNQLIIGYFQCAEIISDRDVLEQMRRIKLKEMSQEILNLRNIALQKKPLVVHIRLQDYLLSEELGVLGANYYMDAISRALQTAEFQELWLFSDDITKARTYLNEIDSLYVREFDSNVYSTIETFEIMRLGFGYVIANSSFSWWAANLSHELEPLVFAPHPWFNKSQTMGWIYPKYWNLVESSFQRDSLA